MDHVRCAGDRRAEPRHVWTESPHPDHPAVPPGRKRRLDQAVLEQCLQPSPRHSVHRAVRAEYGSGRHGVTNEMTRADVTAVSVFQATMAVPGRVIPNDPDVEAAVLLGEQRFASMACTSCHVPALPLDRQGWLFSEPNPYNPASPPHLQVGPAPTPTPGRARACSHHTAS